MNAQKDTASIPVPADPAPQKPAKKVKKEKEFRRVKSISPMAYVIPYIMVDRTGSQNFIQDSVEIENSKNT